MYITSKAIINGQFLDQYGKRGTFFTDGMANYSIPFQIFDAPKATVSYVVVLLDHDAIPVSGFTFIHWVIANLQTTDVEADASSKKVLLEGVNSCLKKVGAEKASTYVGMSPPDQEHTYALHVYALDTLLDLKQPFYLNEVYKQMEGHVLAEAVIKGKYKA